MLQIVVLSVCHLFPVTELASVAGAEVRDLGSDRGGKFSSNQFAGGFVEEAAWSKEGHPNHR